MVCNNFTPNIFKPDFCMQCQRPRSEHNEPPVEVKNKVACKEFVSNPFKNDICKICQLGKKNHITVNMPSVVVTRRESTSNPDSVCDSYEPNPFKGDICKVCRLSKALHKGVAVTSVSKPISAKPVAQAVTEKKVPTPAAAMSSPKKQNVAVLKTVQSSVSQSPKKEPEHTNVRQNPVVPPHHTPTEAGVACDEFEPNPFKPALCKGCRLPKSMHAASALDNASEKGSPSTASNPEPKPALKPVQSSVSQSPKKEADHTNVKQNPVVPPPHTPTEAGSACDEFEPNPFKPALCKCCRLSKSMHSALGKEPEKAPSTASKPEPKPLAATNPIVSKNPPRRQVVESDSDSDTGKKPAVTPPKPTPRKPIDSDSTDDEPPKKADVAALKSVQSSVTQSPKKEAEHTNVLLNPSRMNMADISDDDKELGNIDVAPVANGNPGGDSDEDGAKNSVKSPTKSVIPKRMSLACDDSSDDEAYRAPVQAPRKIAVKKPTPKKMTYNDDDSGDGEEMITSSKKMLEKKKSDADFQLASKKKKAYSESDDGDEEAIVKVGSHVNKKENSVLKPKINFNPQASSDHHQRFRQQNVSTATSTKKANCGSFGSDDDDLSAPVVKKIIIPE